MRISTKLIGAVAVAGVLAAGGAALTDSNTVADSVAGYGSAVVTGATASAIVHTLSADGLGIVSTQITFSVTQAGRTVVAGFGATDLESCVVVTTTATCTYGTPYVTATATEFHVAVS